MTDFERLADCFETELRTRAERCGWSAVPNVSLANTQETAVSKLLAGLPASDARDTPPLPELRRAFDLAPASLSLLLCSLDEADESYRAALWWTGLVRSEIAPSRRSDLHLFLIGPSGSNNDPRWRGKQSRIESDERFCRKFLWLPPPEPLSEGMGAFFDRTFLAQPWQGAPAEPRSLDPLERLIEESDINGLLSADEARRWIRHLGSRDGATGQLAEELVAILEELP